MKIFDLYAWSIDMLHVLSELFVAVDGMRAEHAHELYRTPRTPVDVDQILRSAVPMPMCLTHFAQYGVGRGESKGLLM